MYVAVNGLLGSRYADTAHGRVGRGAELFRFDAAGKLTWRLQGTEFVHCGAADPGNPADYYTTENRYVLDYRKATAAGANPESFRLAGYHLDAGRYPDDLRLHTYVKSARVFRAQGRKLMYVSSDGAGTFRMVYRFDGEIAVPAAMFAADARIYHPIEKTTWPNIAPNASFIWTDADGDGAMDGNEFQTMAGGAILTHIDADGNAWCGDKGKQGIYRFPFQGFTAAGVPQWTPASGVGPVKPEGDIHHLSRFTVLPGGTAAIVGVYTAENPAVTDKNEQNEAGREIRRYDNWQHLFDGRASTRPTRTWTRIGKDPADPAYDDRTNFPYAFVSNGHHNRDTQRRPVTLQAADGAYFFLGYDIKGTKVADNLNPDILVFRADTAAYVGHFSPTPDLATFNLGALDFGQDSISVVKRGDGTYTIFCEDYPGAKNVYYQWKPGGETAARVLPAKPAAPAFPLKVSASRRHLEDQCGRPFLVVADTP
jgi:hypothetical protein